ncbi:MAG: hypothetical protein F7C07_04525 [Desulfurococcales archaeon]|nr:hypothetical protein [Desulfurococcales archaeon]
MLEQRDPAKEAELDPRITSEILDRAFKELPREKSLTPFKVATRLGIPISSAKRVLRLLESKGLVKLYSPNRRNPIYVPQATPGKEQPVKAAERKEQPKRARKQRKTSK